MLTWYKILVNLAYAVLWPYFAVRRMRARDEWTQRRCLPPHDYLPAGGPGSSDKPDENPVCLFHASSVGEVRVLERLVAALRRLRPDLPYCISTYTRTGQHLARRRFPDAVAVFYFPLDCRLPLKRFFSRYRPRGVVFVETEIWPCFLDSCRRFDIPAVLANGRLTPKSTKRYRLFRTGLRPLLRGYRRFLMQTEDDADRIRAIGADPERITVLGNIKHDPVAGVDAAEKRAEVRRRLAVTGNRILLVAASTRPGEEEILCRALGKTALFPGRLAVLVAPRHLERLDEVSHILSAAGFACSRYSDIESGDAEAQPVILMDKIGLLAELFYGADLAFVGGTLADLGGHNIMEPVVAGVPVLFGPSVDNVREAAAAVQDNNLGLMVRDADDLARAMERFASGALQFGKMQPNGSSVADRTAEVIVREFGW